MAVPQELLTRFAGAWHDRIRRISSLHTPLRAENNSDVNCRLWINADGNPERGRMEGLILLAKLATVDRVAWPEQVQAIWCRGWARSHRLVHRIDQAAQQNAAIGVSFVVLNAEDVAGLKECLDTLDFDLPDFQDVLAELDKLRGGTGTESRDSGALEVPVRIDICEIGDNFVETLSQLRDIVVDTETRTGLRAVFCITQLTIHDDNEAPWIDWDSLQLLKSLAQLGVHIRELSQLTDTPVNVIDRLVALRVLFPSVDGQAGIVVADVGDTWAPSMTAGFLS